jgi:hypothetical protein
MPYEAPTAINPQDQPLVNQLCQECRALIAASRSAPVPVAFSQNIQQIFILTGVSETYLASYFNDVI